MRRPEYLRGRVDYPGGLCTLAYSFRWNVSASDIYSAGTLARRNKSAMTPVTIDDSFAGYCLSLIVLIYSDSVYFQKFRVFHYMAARIFTCKISVTEWRRQKLYHMFLSRNNLELYLSLCPCCEIRQTFRTQKYSLSLLTSNISNAQDRDKRLRSTLLRMLEKLHMNIYLLPH